MNESLIYSQRKEHRESELLDAAMATFAEYGYKKASMGDIAAKLGITAAALYRYARDKEDLYRQVVARGFRLWQETTIAAAEATPDPVESFRTACKTAFRYLGEEPLLRRILAKDPQLFPLFEKDDPFTEINRASEALLEELLMRGVEAGVFATVDAAATAKVLFSFYSVFIQKAYIATEEEDALFERGLDLVLNGLLVR